jgi:hypothetical protein
MTSYLIYVYFIFSLYDRQSASFILLLIALSMDKLIFLTTSLLAYLPGMLHGTAEWNGWLVGNLIVASTLTEAARNLNDSTSPGVDQSKLDRSGFSPVQSE